MVNQGTEGPSVFEPSSDVSGLSTWGLWFGRLDRGAAHWIAVLIVTAALAVCAVIVAKDLAGDCATLRRRWFFRLRPNCCGSGEDPEPEGRDSRHHTFAEKRPPRDHLLRVHLRSPSPQAPTTGSPGVVSIQRVRGDLPATQVTGRRPICGQWQPSSPGSAPSALLSTTSMMASRYRASLGRVWSESRQIRVTESQMHSAKHARCPVGSPFHQYWSCPARGLLVQQLRDADEPWLRQYAARS